jgi:Arc/MetJ family transcription regulator
MPIGGIDLAGRGSLKRKAFFVDELALRQARKALGVDTDSEAVRLSVERVAEMEVFWRFMQRSRRRLERGSIRP